VTLLKKILFGAALVLLVCVAAVFAYNNPDPVSIDIGLARIESISLTLALACAFALGWLFGLATAGFALLRMAAEKRRIRRELRNAETEVASLRTLPINDAN
jgi:uncharacterized integral membrane protein